MNPNKFSAAWGHLDLITQATFEAGDSNCYYGNADTGFGFSVSVYYGPDRGADVVFGAAISTPRPTTISGRPALTFKNGSVGCGLAFDFGPDQSVTILVIGPKSAVDPCAVVQGLATYAATKLPPS